MVRKGHTTYAAARGRLLRGINFQGVIANLFRGGPTTKEASIIRMLGKRVFLDRGNK